jgi:hypothetical protein
MSDTKLLEVKELNTKSVNIVYHLPATAVEITIGTTDVKSGGGRFRQIVQEKAKQFIEDSNLFKIKPDFRFFLFGEAEDQDNVWITIPDDFEVPPPYKKINYPGGLYASCVGEETTVVGEWVAQSTKYEWHNDNFSRAIGWEYFNPFNVMGLDDYEYGKSWDCSYATELYPIREIKHIPDEKIEKATGILNRLQIHRTTEINFSTMNEHKQDGGIFEVNFPNGLLELKVDNDYHSGAMTTAQKFQSPLKIELRAKTNKTNININYADMYIGLKDMDVKRNMLAIIDSADGGWEFESYDKYGALPLNEFVDIVVYFGKFELIVTVNGELRHYREHYKYIKNYNENPEFSLSGDVSVGTGWGSTLTAEWLRISEVS